MAQILYSGRYSKYPVEWYRKNGIPSDWNLMYTEDIKNLVYNLYRKDFEMFEYDR